MYDFDCRRAKIVDDFVIEIIKGRWQFMLDSMAESRADHLICIFDVLRAHHKSCVGRCHYVMLFDGRLFILHPEEANQCNGEVLLRTGKIHGNNISESQRATLRQRIKAYLKGKS